MLNVFVVAILYLSGVIGESVVERQVLGGIEAVRLVGGPISQLGRLEVMSGGVWGTVCDDLFNDNAATVVCRSLGFQGDNIGFLAYENGYPLPATDNTTRILLDDIRCFGNESSLNDCGHRPIGENNCGHNEDVSIGCAFDTIEAVRLNGGPNEQSGRVEIMSQGIWGSICGYSFDVHLAGVVCRSLGFQARYGRNYYGLNLHGAPLHFQLGGVYCWGNETQLAECRHMPIGRSNCFTMGYVVYVTCEPSTIDHIRLVNGLNLHEGRVEVFMNGTWGTVCDDDFSNSTASVVCRMLGFEPQGAEAIHDAPFGMGSGAILLDDVVCRGNETTLSDCEYTTEDNCGHYEDVGVRCG